MIKDQQRIERHSIPEPNSGCWIWTGGVSEVGYGLCGSENKKTISAHRLSYSVFKTEIPDGMVVCHKCDTPSCANPAHLFLGTQAENLADAKSKNRLKNPNRGGNQRKTHCPKGHSYADAYQYVVGGWNTRVCRTCAVERSRAARRRKQST